MLVSSNTVARALAAALLTVTTGAVAGASGCSSSASEDGRAVAQMTDAIDGSPWPFDGHREGDHLRVTGLSKFDGQEEKLRDLEAALSELDGTPVKTSIFFPTIGGSLADGPMEGSAHVVDLSDADPDAPVEFKLFHRLATREVVALSPVGHAFREGHRYGCWLDDRVVRASSEMNDALHGRGARASIFAPLVTKLGAETRVGAATVFTVGHPTRLLDAMRDVVDGTAPPRARVDKVIVGAAALDDFFGKPTTTRSGLGDPAGITHDQVFAVVLGSFEAPYFLGNDLHDREHLGRIARDAAGKPTVQGAATVPFLLTLPRAPQGGDLAKTPVMIFQHGLNAGRWQVTTVANDYARAGYATIGVDALWHGERRPGHEDAVHNFSGAPGADGLADNDDLGASLVFFDFNGDAAVGAHALDGRYVRDNFRQAVLDLTELTRLLKDGDLSAVAAADPALASLTLDAAHLVYTSESFGSILGAMTLAVDARLEAGVLSVGGAGIFLPTFADSPFFARLAFLFLKSGFDHDLDVTAPASLPAEAQRSLSLLQAALEPGDPIAFASKIARYPDAARGRKPKSLLLLQANSDELIPNQSGELLASVSGATAVTIEGHTKPLRYVSLPVAAAPFGGSTSEVTVAIVNVDPATHTMFTGFKAAREYEPDFPPPRKLPAPIDVDNPIEWLHGLAVRVASGQRSDPPSVVVAGP
jgi:hypothetical protein